MWPPLPEPTGPAGRNGLSQPGMMGYGAPHANQHPLESAPLPGEFGYGQPHALQAAPPTIRDFSWIHIDHPVERAFKVNDIVTVIVSERSEVILNSRFNRQRNATLKSELREFIRLDGFGLQNAAGTRPTIDMNQQERLQSMGQVTDQEGITYRIAATIVDIRPNGNLVLEARKRIDANDDLWEYTLHGEVRYEDVQRNNTILSENIANLNIEKSQQGRVQSSTGRRWGNKLIDRFWPF
jgi:flagellar L-ring protein FlgH